MGEPSWGERKRTPSSVMVASSRRETIWKLWWVEVSLGLWLRMIVGGLGGDEPAAVSEQVVLPAL